MLSLKTGSHGPAVRQLQLLLNAQLSPSPNLPADGSFGPRTRDALLRFQTAKHLTADGIAGPLVMHALGQKPVSIVAPAGTGPAWLQIAQAELGIHENSLPGQQNKRIIEYHAATTLKAQIDEVPWCSSFVNWVMKQAGYTGTGNALAMSWLTWGREQKTPQAGAITVIKKKGANKDHATGSSTGFHVGFYVGSTPSAIRLLGGNQGDSVKYSNFMLAGYDIRGYRWPA
jgi:uncharacterized protein (TIGR02594 family)